MTYVLLIAAAFLAGAINSVAGGGSFLTFPALVFAGIPPVAANASSTVALVPAALTAALGYRGDIRRIGEARVKSWLLISLFGGAFGAALLLLTSDRSFGQIAPWLLLFATLIFAFGNRIGIAFRGRLHSNQSLMLLFLLPVSIYGGYFGGGIGIMILSALRLYGLTDINGMNGIKSILGGSLNAIAAAIFIGSHHVSWAPTLVMMAAATCGGYLGPQVARRLPPNFVRGLVIAVGTLMTVYFFWVARKA